LTDDGLRFPNRDIIIMLMIFVFSFTLVAVTMYFIFHFDVGLLESILVGDYVGIGCLTALLIYRQRFRDERSIRILDKSGRNGFLSMLYLLPVFLLIYSLVEYSVEAAWALIEFWGCSAVIVIVSAVYYYRK
jgi:hypothetical protein